MLTSACYPCSRVSGATLANLLIQSDAPVTLGKLPWSQRESIGPGWQWVVFVLVLLCLFSRCPQMFLHAQFYAEDGRYWYAQAYNLGWLHALLVPQAGYLQTLPRLVAAFTLLFPLGFAPLIMNLFGIVMQALPVTALLSARCRNWGPLPLRVLMALIYIAIPNAAEIHVVVTNAQWHLVVLEILLGLGAAPRGWPGRIRDTAIFLLGSVSGPFSIMLLPFVLFFWWKRRERWTLYLASLMGTGAIIQLFAMAHTTRALPAPLGATPALLLRMLGGEVVLSSIFGPRHAGSGLSTAVLLLAVGLGLLVTGYALLRARLPLRLLIAFTAVFLAAALRSPYVGQMMAHPPPLWQFLLLLHGCRYWFYPMLAFLWAAAFCIFQRLSVGMRIVGLAVLVPMVVGIAGDWRYPAFADQQFNQSVQRLQRADPGQHVVIPIPPYPWSMELVKR